MVLNNNLPKTFEKYRTISFSPLSWVMIKRFPKNATNTPGVQSRNANLLPDDKSTVMWVDPLSIGSDGNYMAPSQMRSLFIPVCNSLRIKERPPISCPSRNDRTYQTCLDLSITRWHWIRGCCVVLTFPEICWCSVLAWRLPFRSLGIAKS